MCNAQNARKLISELISLRGRTAVVTGAGSGIGLAIAERLAEAGAEVLVADPDLSASANAAYHINSSYGVKAVASELDIADGASVKETCAQALRELGSIAIWVNNAGIYPVTPLLEITDNQWDKVMNTNLRGAFIASREAAVRMVAGGLGGVIVNVASTASPKTGGLAPHYLTSGHGLAGLTKSLAVELGPKGIRALAVVPPVVETPGMGALKQSYAGVEEKLQTHAAGLSLRRPASPDEVARVVLFCASDLAALMTGCLIPVDGYGERLFAV